MFGVVEGMVSAPRLEGRAHACEQIEPYCQALQSLPHPLKRMRKVRELNVELCRTYLNYF